MIMKKTLLTLIIAVLSMSMAAQTKDTKLQLTLD